MSSYGENRPLVLYCVNRAETPHEHSDRFKPHGNYLLLDRKDTTTIGTSEDNDIVVFPGPKNDRSDRWAVISFSCTFFDESYTIEDVSKYGVFVNCCRLTKGRPIELHSGDIIDFGTSSNTLIDTESDHFFVDANWYLLVSSQREGDDRRRRESLNNPVEQSIANLGKQVETKCGRTLSDKFMEVYNEKRIEAAKNGAEQVDKKEAQVALDILREEILNMGDKNTSPTASEKTKRTLEENFPDLVSIDTEDVFYHKLLDGLLLMPKKTIHEIQLVWFQIDRIGVSKHLSQLIRYSFFRESKTPINKSIHIGTDRLFEVDEFVFVPDEAHHPKCQYISGNHARIEAVINKKKEFELYITDLSHCGTFLNGRRLMKQKQTRIHYNDIIGFGFPGCATNRGNAVDYRKIQSGFEFEFRVMQPPQNDIPSRFSEIPIGNIYVLEEIKSKTPVPLNPIPIINEFLMPQIGEESSSELLPSMDNLAGLLAKLCNSVEVMSSETQ